MLLDTVYPDGSYMDASGQPWHTKAHYEASVVYYKRIEILINQLRELQYQLKISKIDKEVTRFIEECVEDRVEEILEGVYKLEEVYNGEWVKLNDI